MRRLPLWLLLVGSGVVVIGVLLQAFSIVAWIRGAGPGALDMHKDVADVVHVGELAVVVGAIWAWWGNWRAVGLAALFLVVSVLQVVLIGDTDKQGGWVNGLHGLLALVVLIAALAYAEQASRRLGFHARIAPPG